MKQITKFNFSKLLTLAVFVLVLFGGEQQAFSEEGIIWTRDVMPYTLINAVFSPDDQYIYATIGYKTIDVVKYDLQGNVLDTIKGIGGIKQFSEDGQFFWNYNGDKYDANTFQKLLSFGGGGYNISGWQWQINEKSDIGVAHGGINASKVTQDSNLIFFRPSDCKLLSYTSYPDKHYQFRAIGINPSGTEMAIYILTNRYDMNSGEYVVDSMKLEIWNIQEFKKLREIKMERGTNILLKYSPDGSVLGYQHDGKLTLYSTTDYSVVWESTGILSYLFNWTNDMKYLYCSQMEFGLNKYNYDTKLMIHHFNLPSYSEFINFDSKNNYCICSWGDGELILLDNTISSVSDPFFTEKYQTTITQEQTNKSTNLLINAQLPTKATYTITNSLGVICSKPITLNLVQGQNNYEINTTNLQSGTYFINLTIQDHTTNLKFIVVR